MLAFLTTKIRLWRTLGHPMELDGASIEDALYPSIFPSEEFDELDCHDELVQYAHSVITCSRGLLRYRSRPLRHYIVERQGEDDDSEARQGGPSKKPI